MLKAATRHWLKICGFSYFLVRVTQFIEPLPQFSRGQNLQRGPCEEEKEEKEPSSSDFTKEPSSK